jgi:hypothetical protein
MLWLAIVPFAAAQERLRLAAIEVGGTDGTLSDKGGMQARAEWSTGRALHVGAQGSWNQGEAVREPGDFPTPDQFDSETPTQGHDFRALAALSVHLDDRHVQVGIGLAAGPWILVDRDTPSVDHLTGEVTIEPATEVVLRAFWTTSVRLRISHGIGVYFATTGDLGTARADASLGVGWTR